MPSDMEEKVRRIVREEMGKYSEVSRRSENRIRDLIQEELGKRPKTKHELSRAIDSTTSTVENHLEHLENLDVVEKFQHDGSCYWRLVE